MAPTRDERPLVAAWSASPEHAAADRVIGWLRANFRSFASVLELDVRHERCLLLDFDASSPLLDSPDGDNSEPALTARIRRAMLGAGVRLAVGSYDELRPPYPQHDPADPGDPRVVHLGVDLFAEPGSAVQAPLAGIVHDVGASASPLGYGPTIVLRHDIDRDTRFFTLYGHLDRDAIDLCHQDQPVAAGSRLGRIGTPEVNGGWTPHLHFQVVTDLLGLGRRFPGMGHLSQREAWRLLSPNPNLILGIPVLSRAPGGRIV